ATTYKSSNTKVAKVDSKGKVTALKAGTAKITVTNNKVSKTFTVTVKNPKLSKTKLTLKPEESYTLKVTGKIGKATFTSSKKSVVKVNSAGKIVAKKKGKAVITVKTNGITLKCNVVVK
ncbi:MAG: Ig-like domain-containing protein, partial [Ruminococcus sp.]